MFHVKHNTINLMFGGWTKLAVAEEVIQIPAVDAIGHDGDLIYVVINDLFLPPWDKGYIPKEGDIIRIICEPDDVARFVHKDTPVTIRRQS